MNRLVVITLLSACSFRHIALSNCKENADCDKGLVCVNRVCDVAQVVEPPTISEVRGDKAVGSGYVVAAGFVVTGTGFDSGLQAKLTDSVGTVYDLAVSNASATQFNAAMPTTLAVTSSTVATSVTLVLTNSAGSVTRELSVLRGEDGLNGSNGAPGAPGASGISPDLTNYTGAVGINSSGSLQLQNNSASAVATFTNQGTGASVKGTSSNATGIGVQAINTGGGTALAVSGGVTLDATAIAAVATALRSQFVLGTMVTETSQPSVTGSCPASRVAVSGSCACGNSKLLVSSGQAYMQPTQWECICSGVATGAVGGAHTAQAICF